MRVPRGVREAWRLAMVPLVVWLLLVIVGTGVLLWQQNNSRQAVAERFDNGVQLLGDFMTTVVADQLVRERIQAQAWLIEPTVTARDFDLVVAGFGYPSAVLLDSDGRVIQNYPADSKLIGQDLAGRYEHLRTALQGRMAVSSVVPNAAQGISVVAFAVPFETTSGRRVFSGAISIKASPLSAYLSTALSLSKAEVRLADTGGHVLAATDTFDSAEPTLASEDAPLNTALGRASDGRYRAGGAWWRYSSVAIPGTPWRMSAAVRESELYASLVDNEIAGRAALGGAALVGLAVVVAIGRVRVSRRGLLVSERRFRKVFDGSRIGMVLADLQGRCVWVNPAACQILGRGEDEVLGHLLADFGHPDDAGLSTGPMRDCLAGDIDGFDLDKRYVRPEGDVVEASVTTAVLRDEQDRPQYFATQIINTTERRALERERERIQTELTERAAELQDANTNLADVMAMLSHDVRQPLAKIVGLGGLLQEEWGEIPAHTRINYIQRMTAAGHRANDLVTDILTLAQLDAGAILARPVRIDISQAAREAVAAHHISAGTPISVIVPDETAGLADPAQLQLVLGNLLTNATKYGTPPIEVTVVNAEEQVAIRVADRGEGVPPEFVPRLFDRFARAESGVATTTAGTGLGLYLVRQLAQAGGLDVSYEPNQPHGAVFTVSIPRAAHVPRVSTPEKENVFP
ncbi:ATP-binding protein [Actinoplanes sp. NPDC026619]|uniref:sensor histidine kinase n=1 Tax=Actinoplanes sp. NPDC026619 TaxID=3155798 RepID=UPI0033FA7B6F